MANHQSSGSWWTPQTMVEKAMMRGRMQAFVYMLPFATGVLMRRHDFPWWLDITIMLGPCLLLLALLEWYFRRHPLTGP